MKVDWRELPGRYVKDPRLGHRLGRNYPAGEVSDIEWNIRWLGSDAEGFIYNDAPIRDFRIDDSSYERLFLLGGSTVMGLGVEKNSETIASVLERYLRKGNPTARTINCGCGAYVSWQEMTYLTTELILNEPDFVITLNGWNDFVHSSWGNKGLNGGWIPNTHRSLDDVVAILQAEGGHLPLLEILLLKIKRLPFIRELETRGMKVRPGVSNDTNWKLWSLKPFSVECYLSNLRTIIGTARTHGSRAICLLQPQLLWGDRSQTEEEQELVNRISTRVPPMASLAPEWFERAQRGFKELRAEFHDGATIWIEDASSWLDHAPEQVYHDYNHYNLRGQEIIGSKLSTIVEQMKATSRKLSSREITREIT